MQWIILLVATAFAGPALAEVLDTKTARVQLFPVRGHAIQLSGKLSEADRQVVKGIIPLMAKQLNQPVRYYASIAYSPDDGLVHEALQAAMNYHSYAASDAAAIAACNRIKSKAARSCEVAARVVPKRFKPRDLTLSVEATVAFNKTYRRTRGTKAFAISEATGAWGMGASEAAALGSCGVMIAKS